MIWQFVSDPSLCFRLCLTLLHSLWQVPLFVLAAWGASRFRRRRSVERDYAIHVAALLASLVAIPVTFSSLSVARTDAPLAITISEPSSAADNGPRFEPAREIAA